MKSAKTHMSSNIESNPTVSFIVPALNEQFNLPRLFERLLALGDRLDHGIEIVVVDDSSNDQTLEIAHAAAKLHPEIRVFSKPLPHGLGRGIRFSLQHARGRIAIVAMADGVDPLEEAVPKFCEKILSEGCHLVLLSRYCANADADTIPFSYKFFHVIFRLCTRYLLGIHYRDTTYAFRAIDLEFVRRLGLSGDAFEISPEITFKTYFAGGRIGEVAGRQTRRVHGKSNFIFTKAARGYVRVLLQALGMRLSRRRVGVVADAGT